MPIYEYACTACAHKLEVLQKLNDEPLQQCPECGQNTLKKLVSLTAFQLKGTGWYETDYKKRSARHEEDGPPACGSGGCSSCAMDAA